LPTPSKPTGGVDYFSVFFDEAADMGIGQEIEHRFGGPAELDALRRDDDRPVDQDRMCQHLLNAVLYVVAQIAGGIAGTMAAHLMFALPVVDFSMKTRTGGAQWFAESTFRSVSMRANRPCWFSGRLRWRDYPTLAEKPIFA
jgi:hypothetical protein